jgi:Skp family chaperone for outer membrane proteins
MITLVDRDENNKVRIIPGPAEEAAVLRLVESMTPEAAEKVRAGLEQRRKKVAETLAREAATALMIRGKLDELERTGDMKTLQTLGEQMRAVQTQPTLIKFLQAQSALQPRWAIRADKAAQDYVKAVNRDVREGLGEGNMQGLVIETMRTTLRNNTLEPMRELDRLLADGAGRWADLRPTLGLTPEQAAKAAAAEKDLSATDQRGRANAMAAVLGALTAEQQRTALAAVAGVDLSALPPPPAPAGSPGAPGGATKPADR